MKKVKFTLGLMLAMLLLGANVMNAALEPERPGAKYGSMIGSTLTDNRDGALWDFQVHVGVSISASPSYANGTGMSTPNDPYRFDGDNDAIMIKTVYQYNHIDAPTPPYGGGISGFPYGIMSKVDVDGDGVLNDYFDIRRESFYINSNGKKLSHATDPYDNGLWWVGYFEFDNILKYSGSLNHDFQIKLAYDKGKEIIPFVRRTIFLGMWMYDTVEEQNVWVESGLTIEELLLPEKRTDVTDFAYGSGVATYNYVSKLFPHYMKEPIHSVHYEIWTNDEVSDNPGAGNANVHINRAVTIEAADGISTNQVFNKIQVPSGTDFTFDVTGEAGKELVVTTSSSYWSVENGGVKIVPNGSGKWKVTLTKVRATMTVKVGYANTPESGDGGDGTTGNDGSLTEDKVWGSAGTLYVKSAGEGTLSIYSVTGQLSKTVVVNGDYTTTMPKGLYIVQFKGKAYKVIL